MSIRPSFQSALLIPPIQGSMVMPVQLDFTASGTVDVDLQEEMALRRLDVAQSVYIDNSLNPAALAINFVDTILANGYKVTAQPYSQGWYPIAVPTGALTFRATTTQGRLINLHIANCAMPYVVWGPLAGADIVPALTNLAFNAVALGVGNTQLLAGVPGTNINLYRGVFNVDGPTILKFTDGPGGTVLFTATLTGFGAINFNPSNASWFTTSPGNELTLNSSAVVNLYGGMGYVQA